MFSYSIIRNENALLATNNCQVGSVVYLISESIKNLPRDPDVKETCSMSEVMRKYQCVK